jgi:hypothetical protein
MLFDISIQLLKKFGVSTVCYSIYRYNCLRILVSTVCYSIHRYTIRCDIYCDMTIKTLTVAWERLHKQAIRR